MVALVVAAAAGAVSGWGGPHWWALFPGIAGYAAGSFVASAPTVARRRWGSAPVDSVAAVCLTLLPGAWITVCAGVGILLAQSLRRLAWHRRLDAALRGTAAAGVGAAAAYALRDVGAGDFVAAGVGVAAYWLVGHVLAVVTVARATGRRVPSLIRSRAGATVPGAALGAAVGITSAGLAVHAPAGLLGLLAPVVLAVSSVRNGARVAAESQILTELLGAQSGRSRTGSSPGRRSLDDSVQLVVTSAARLLGGADVEVVTLGAGGVLRFAGREHGDAARSQAMPDAYDDPWVRVLIQPFTSGSRARGRRGVDGDRPVLAVRLGPPGSTASVLVARRPAGAAEFRRADVRLVEALAAHTSNWQGFQTAPGQDSPGSPESSANPADAALDALRGSATRLARLADSPAARAGEADLDLVVSELRELERAVASLVGAPVVADAAPRRATRRSPVPQDADGWTTSGVMSEADL